MINIKKGTAFTLQQSDVRGFNPNPAQYGSGTAITAGALCYVSAPSSIGTVGTVTAVPAGGGVPSTFVGLKGFAINNSYDGDAIESGKIALYTLDGNSIIETDQLTVTTVQ